MTTTKLGNYIKQKRLSMAETQEETAKKIGVTVVTLSKIERGQKVGSRTLKKLSKFTNVNTKLLREMMLMDFDEEEDNDES